MKKLLFKLIIIAVAFALCGCKKEKTETPTSIIQENLNQISDTQDTQSAKENYDDYSATLIEGNAGYTKPKENPAKPLIPNEKQNNKAHSGYLKDALNFNAMPENFGKDKTLVVASNKAVLYKTATPKSDDELKSLVEIEKLPKGTLLRVTGNVIKATSKGEDYNGLFEFQDEMNWFYPVEYNGKEGIVFGADLFGMEKRPEITAAVSVLYKNSNKDGFSHFENFYPMCGYSSINQDISKTLTENKIAIQEVGQKEYWLDTVRPDDMVALYQTHTERYSIKGDTMPALMGKDLIPLFITTDLFAHTQHLAFDRILQHTEEEILLPRLHSLSKDFIEKISADLEKNPGNETVQKALDYFKVGKALLELTPTLKKRNSWEEDEWEEPNREKILANYNEQILKEIELIDAAQGFGNSALFKFADGGFYVEDYSQYKPRGHYTISGNLKAYFRAMMWFGRINFSLPDSSRKSDDDREVIARDMTRVALYIISIAQQNQDMYKKWNSVFEPMTVLIGQSDDISFNDVFPVWKTFKASNALEWISKDENLYKFSELARKEIKPPLITGTSAFYANQSEGGVGDPESLKPAMGWRFLGQRFTYDAWMFDQVSSPRLYSRTSVYGLDVASSFGAGYAQPLQKTEYEKLKEERKKKNLPIFEYEKLNSIFERFKNFFNSKNEKFWNETYYNSVLSLTKAQTEFGQGAGFYFTQSPLWNKKALEASLGTWAELKHDTLLYTKQSMAEMGGGGFRPTYRIDKLPQTVHYIEPNLNFFINLCNSWNTLNRILWEYNLFDERSQAAVAEMEATARHALEIVRLEIQDAPVPKAEIEWIGTIPWILARNVMPFSNSYDTSSSNPEQFKMAIVADVFTNAEEGFVLEVAVGIPQRIYVALNDKQGGKRIAVGYIFNYYEFENPMNQRLTDEEWKKMVYEKPDSIKGKKPVWLSPEAALKPTGFGK